MKPFLPKANRNKPRFEFPAMLNPPFHGKRRRSKDNSCDSSASSGEGGVLRGTRGGVWTISDPNQNDVLCGRSNRFNNHSGNVHFRQVIENERKRCNAKSRKKAEKANIAILIVQQIRSMNPSGRFLKEDPKHGLWFDIGDAKAIKKVTQELRKSSNDPPARSGSEISYISVPEGTAATMNTTATEQDQNGLNPEDFPVGRPYPFHPKIKLLNSMVDDLHTEYAEADKIAKRTLGNGKELRSRHEIINLVSGSLLSSKGKFKKKQKDGSWIVDRNYSESKLRTRIINAFNNHREKSSKSDTDSALSTTYEKMTIVTESTGSVTIEDSASNGRESTAASLPQDNMLEDTHGHAFNMFQQPLQTPVRKLSDESVEKGGKIVFDQVWQQISSQYDCANHDNFDLPFSKEELAPDDILMLNDYAMTTTEPINASSLSHEMALAAGQAVHHMHSSDMNTMHTTHEEMIDGVDPMEFEFGRFFKPVEETSMSMSISDGLPTSANNMNTSMPTNNNISGSSSSSMRSTISGMRSNLSGLRPTSLHERKRNKKR